MSKEERKARELIAKIDKEGANKKREEYEKEHGIPMYEPAGCYKCDRGQLYSGGGSELSVTYYRRCACANVYTKRYKEFLEQADNMNHGEYVKMKEKFVDNNNHIDVGSNATDRSW